MANRQAEGVLHGLRYLAEAQAAQLTDGQLLNRFAADRDEGAFAALLQRHGSLVYGVCRNILRHDQDAEDAFQGTFLVLARRAAVIRHEKALGSWLYRVAYRVSMKARSAADRQRRREMAAVKSAEDQPVGDLAWRELQAMLDAELNRLPEKYRAPFVLCVLTGKSKAEAAAELGWKEGTVSSRLAKAREVLQRRLARRGVALSAVLSGLAISQPGASAIVPAALLAATRKAALAFAAGGRAAAEVAAIPAALARSVLQGMSAARLKLPAALLVIAGLAGAAAVLALDRPADPVGPVAPAPADPPAERPLVGTSVPNVDGLHQLLVRGQVVGGDGKAVPGADVMILVDEDRPAGLRDFSSYGRRRVVATGKADAEGRFQFVTPRPSERRGELFHCLARGAGHAVNWQHLQVVVPTPPVVLNLEQGKQLRGRLVDSQGVPAGGVTLRFGGFSRPGEPLRASPDDVDVPAWPAPIVTDAEGRFVVNGVLRHSTVYLQLLDDRYGPHWLTLTTKDDEQTDVSTIRLPAPRVLEGTVVAEGTGAPLAGALVSVSSYTRGSSSVPASVNGRTDEAGRFRIMPYPGDSLAVYAAGSPGSPYLAAQDRVEWAAGAPAPKNLTLRLTRGVVVCGSVVEHGTGRPVAGARVQYRPMSGRNRNGDKGNLLVLWQWLDAATDDDGKFELPVLPGPGHLKVRGPGHDWIPLEVDEYELIYAKTGSDRFYYPDALVPIDVNPNNALVPTVAKVRRGTTLRGRVNKADGTPSASGFLVSRMYLGNGWEEHSRFLPVRDGRFEIPGCDPDRTPTYWFWDHKALQGAAVELSGADETPLVRLAPFGTATVRFVDAGGKPVPGLTPRIQLVVRPGRNRWDSPDKSKPARQTTDVAFQGISADAATGIVNARALIAGARYVIEATVPEFFQPQSTEPFTVGPGEHLRLPDVVVKPPPPRPAAKPNPKRGS